MNILFLDTASRNLSLVLCTEKKILAQKILADRGDAALSSVMEDALKQANLTEKDLTHLACVIGPGGFTSLRIGVAAANALAFALKLPSSGVPLWDVWKERVMPNEGDTQFLWLHSTRRTQIFVKGYGKEGTITPTGVFGLEDAVRLKGPYVGELLPEHEKLLQRCIKIPEEKLLPLEKMFPKFLAGLPYRKQILTPWYGREAD